MLAAFGFVSLIFVVSVGNVYGTLGVVCPGTACDAGNNEICDTGVTDTCICDTGFTAGTIDAATCFQAKDLGVACSADDECLLGNGQTGSKCSTTPVCDCDATNDYVTSAGGAAPCVKDCGPPSVLTGYSAAAGGTTYQSTRTVTCDTGNGYTGNPPVITCDATGSWTAYSGCTTGGGTVDCGAPPSEDGYVPEASPASTLQGATASVTCASGYTGTAAQITCEAGGSWSAYSGCSSGGSRAKLDFSLITVLAVLMLVLI